MEDFIYKQPKRYSWRFWILFWLISGMMLAGWATFLKIRRDGWISLLSYAKPVVHILPATSEQKREILTIFDMIPELTKDDSEKTYLILFQNNMELRPGGGFIGSFGIVKTRGDKVISVETHDTNIVDDRIESGVTPPFPMQQMLRVYDWEMRDSNWSPDFPTNALKAEEFYHMEHGTEQFDGVIAISTDVLTSFLEITGPVSVEGYPGEYTAENAIIKLEYQVEYGYDEQGIEPGKRKYIMKDLAKALVDKAQALSWSQQKQLLEAIEGHLNNRDIMVYFKDDSLQSKVRSLGWSGETKTADGDYLMIVDANMGSLKSDYFISRSFDYTVDFSKEKPQARLKITYEHKGRTRDWMTKDYDTFLRVYVPEGSWLVDAQGVGERRFGNELGKKYFGFMVKVPMGLTKTVELTYDMPEIFTEKDYSLLIQKQSGVGTVPGQLTIISSDGSRKVYSVELNREYSL